MKYFSDRRFLAGLSGSLIGASVMLLALPTLNTLEWWPTHTEHTHSHSEKYHVHADFIIVMNDEILDLSQPEYISTASHKLSDDIHLHDDDGKIEHIHAKNLTFVEFLATLGITLTDECITMKEEKVCTDNDTNLVLFVNDTKFTDSLESYIPADLDRILLYAGSGEASVQEDFLKQVEDRSCIYSGTCPERGIAPAESCGLTCEI